MASSTALRYGARAITSVSTPLLLGPRVPVPASGTGCASKPLASLGTPAWHRPCPPPSRPAEPDQLISAPLPAAVPPTRVPSARSILVAVGVRSPQRIKPRHCTAYGDRLTILSSPSSYSHLVSGQLGSRLGGLFRLLRRNAGPRDRLKPPVVAQRLVDPDQERRSFRAPCWGLVQDDSPGGPEPFCWNRY